ncbi:MAG: J domain-containing protein [Bacteroidia bacterium]
MSRSFYKVLGLQDYASLSEVRRAFKQLAVRYHPDKNPGNRQAEEVFKEISNAYNVLGEAESKQHYDIKLSGLNMYLKENKEDDVEERRKKMREELLRHRKKKEEDKIIDDWNRLNKGTPLWIRHLLNYALIATGAVFIFQNWFYTMETKAPVYIVFAIIFLIVGNIREQNLRYTRYLYRELKGELNFSIPKRIVRNLLIGMVIGAGSGIAGAHLMALYHFENYSMITEAEIVVRYNGGWMYQYKYTVNGKDYHKPLPERFIANYQMDKPLRVRYSSANPVYAKLIEE